jgi:hypothetical protein
MPVSSIIDIDDVVELPICRISLTILLIEISEDAEELATDRITPTISFNMIGDDNTVALPTDTNCLILVSSINIGDEDAMELPMSTS